MTDIRVVANYFGKPPRTFQLWLDSCGQNPRITFLFFTDCNMSRYVLPNNVRVISITFAEMREKLQAPFSYPIQYERAWDFCAFRPVFGSVFKQELDGADFWGWCDCDLIFGDLTSVVELAGGYDKLMSKGHFSLVRNAQPLNDFVLNHPLTRGAISAERTVPCYDELHFRFYVLREFGARQLPETEIPFVNVAPRAGHFTFDCSHALSKRLSLPNNRSVPFILTWYAGKLVGHFAMPDCSVKKVELAYAHFIKRDLHDFVGRLERGCSYLVTPDGVVEASACDYTYEQILNLDRPRIHWKYYRDRLNFRTLKRKAKEFYWRVTKTSPYLPCVYYEGC